jgi:hypothetical protein
LSIPKLDFFIKHSSLRRCSLVRFGVTIFAYYVNPNNAHVKNEKFYVSIGHDMVVDLVGRL